MDRTHELRLPRNAPGYPRFMERWDDSEPGARIKIGGREARSFASVPVSSRAARGFVSRSLRAHGATDRVVDDFALVVGELTANAIEHGDGADLLVALDFTDTQWWNLEVSGPSDAVATWMDDPEQWRIADPYDDTGRGLGITRALMDDIVTKAEAHWLSITCRQRVASAASA
jgi:anti-sigma regulatory factor (Ser/Thr protein kinase)